MFYKFPDPFVLSHNLGAALSLAMVRFIRSTFEKARERFGTARHDIPGHVQGRQRFFFDPYTLTDGLMPPTDRNCRVCGKIGHWGKQCPYNNRSKRRNSEQNDAEKSQKNNAEKSQQNNAEKSLKNNAEKSQQNNAEKSQKNNAEKKQENAVVKHHQHTVQNCQPNKQEKGQQNDARKIEDPKIAEKTLVNNGAKDVEVEKTRKLNSVEKDSQNKHENIPVNWAARIKANSTEGELGHITPTTNNVKGKYCTMGM
jgi:flagellar biosynthesis GTPase FlhF